MSIYHYQYKTRLRNGKEKKSISRRNTVVSAPEIVLDSIGGNLHSNAEIFLQKLFIAENDESHNRQFSVI